MARGDGAAQGPASAALRQALAESEARYRALLDDVLDRAGYGILLVDGGGRLLWVNRTFAAFFGFERATLLGALEQPAIWEPLRRLIDGDPPGPPEQPSAGGPAAVRLWRVRPAAGRAERWLEYQSQAIVSGRYSGGRFDQFFDVTSRRAAEERLRQAAVVFDNSSEGIVVTDGDNRIKAVNRAFTSITGYSEHEILGCDPSVLRSDRHGAEFFEEMWGAIERDGGWRGEIWNRRKSGEVFPEWLSITRVADERGRPAEYISIFSDRSEHKAAEEKIRYQASYDSLTGLPNRSLFVDRLAQELAHARREKHLVALLSIDLDRFRSVNDAGGHRLGDQLLQQAAGRLAEAVRETDTVSRLGGDEFSVLVTGLRHPRGAEVVAETVIGALSRPFVIDRHESYLSASVGITLYPHDGTTGDELLRNADTALYRAKESGRSRFVFFTEQMNNQALERVSLERDLRQALLRDELLLYYQPQWDLQSGRITGAEALLRWQHPERGLISPATFIPVAEESGLIIPVGEWVLHTACEQGRRWLEQRVAPAYLAVNVSSRQFRQGGFVELVRRILADVGLPAQHLQLEITESLLMDDIEQTVEALGALRAHGVRLSIDDFGTGYSSLSYLKRFPIDVLKIDQSFVRDLADDEDDAAIATTIIAMAHTLKKKVVAEGVEHLAQVRFLRGRKCDQAQGFYFSRPLTAQNWPLKRP